MYTREMLAPPKKIISNGKPCFGTFNAPPSKLDICDVKNPFSFCPFPKFITNLRIRASLKYSFNTDNYIGTVSFFDNKFLCSSILILFEKSTQKRYVYQNISGFRRLIPKDLKKATCTTLKSSKYIKFKWDNGDRPTDKSASLHCGSAENASVASATSATSATSVASATSATSATFDGESIATSATKKLSCFFKLKGDSVRPDFGGYLETNNDFEKIAELFQVLPSITKRRCTATYCMTSSVSGFVQKNFHSSKKLAYQKKQAPSEFGISFFDIRRAYYKLRTTENYLIGIDTFEGKNITFRLSQTDHDATDSYKYNENVLFVDNDITPLPPVTITRPFGINGKWIIQDTENMIDLEFYPLSDYKYIASTFVLHTEAHTVFGTFEGELKSKDGTSFRLKGFQGIGTKHLLRL